MEDIQEIGELRFVIGWLTSCLADYVGKEEAAEIRQVAGEYARNKMYEKKEGGANMK